MNLHDLAPAEGARSNGFRVGRGLGSGNGKTSGRGHKGQKARSGYSRKRGFEGGQMPLVRRLPKRGFVNIFAKPLTEVRLDAFNAFQEGSRIGAAELVAAGIIRKCPHGIKVIGSGEITKPVTVAAKKFSDAAKKKIESAGGKIEVV